jgi:catechol 2,3-dioxygenase-like lactoylglutathione lyase family enzyme
MKGRIHHIDLTVSDLARSTEFYARVLPLLGLRRADNVPEGPIFAGDSFELGLVQATSSAKRAHDRYSPGLHHLAFAAPTKESVDAVHAQLVALGVRILDAPAVYERYAPGYYAVFFADPDGVKLEYVFTSGR